MIRAVGSVPNFKGKFTISCVYKRTQMDQLNNYFEDKKGNSLDFYYSGPDKETANILTTKAASVRDGDILNDLQKMFKHDRFIGIKYDSRLNKIDDNEKRFDDDPAMRMSSD